MVRALSFQSKVKCVSDFLRGLVLSGVVLEVSFSSSALSGYVVACSAVYS